MGGAEDAARRDELAAFLRARRDTLQPADLGIVRQGRTRVKGLRRHEVADAAAVSVTWYTWLEQGRDIRTSPQVVDALARALLLDDDGRRHLRRLAGVAISDPETRSPNMDHGLVALVDDLLPHPAHLMEPTTDLVAWNRAYAVVFADPDDHEKPHRNGLWLQLMTDEIRQRLDDWEIETELAIARFRAEAAKYPGDPRFAEVVGELTASSATFRSSWERHQVHRFTGHPEVIHHPTVGTINADLVQLRPLDHPHLTLMVHRLADAASVAGVQQLLGAGAPR